MNYKNFTISKDQTQTIVRYDARRRTWQAVNGTTTDTGRGAPGKREAQRLALANDHPALARAVGAMAYYHHHHEQVVRRLLKGAQLLIDGHVFAGEVRSEHDTGRFYQVSFAGIPCEYRCTCEDAASGRAPRSDVIGGRACKHAWAQHLAFLLAVDLPTSPIPFDGAATHVVAVGDEYDGGTVAGDIYSEIDF